MFFDKFKYDTTFVIILYSILFNQLNLFITDNFPEQNTDISKAREFVPDYMQGNIFERTKHNSRPNS